MIERWRILSDKFSRDEYLTSAELSEMFKGLSAANASLLVDAQEFSELKVVVPTLHNRIAELEAQLDAVRADQVKTACMLVPELAITQIVLEEKLGLIRRYKAALEWVCSGEYSCRKHIDDGTYRVNRVHHPGVNCKAIADTPLAAIEAAMKEEK